MPLKHTLGRNGPRHAACAHATLPVHTPRCLCTCFSAGREKHKVAKVMEDKEGLRSGRRWQETRKHDNRMCCGDLDLILEQRKGHLLCVKENLVRPERSP